MNSIVPFKKVGVPPPAPDVHPAAIAAAQLLVVNQVDPEDFLKAMDWLGAIESDDDD